METTFKKGKVVTNELNGVHRSNEKKNTKNFSKNTWEITNSPTKHFFEGFSSNQIGVEHNMKLKG